MGQDPARRVGVEAAKVFDVLGRHDHGKTVWRWGDGMLRREVNACVFDVLLLAGAAGDDDVHAVGRGRGVLDGVPVGADALAEAAGRFHFVAPKAGDVSADDAVGPTGVTPGAVFGGH